MPLCCLTKPTGKAELCQNRMLRCSTPALTVVCTNQVWDELPEEMLWFAPVCEDFAGFISDVSSQMIV